MDTVSTVPPAVRMTPIHRGRVQVRIAPEARRRLERVLGAGEGSSSALYVRFAPTPELLVIERPTSLPPELSVCDSWGISIVFASTDEARIDGLRIEFDASGAGTAAGAGGGFRLVAPSVDDAATSSLQVDSTCMSCSSSPEDLGERFPLPDLSSVGGTGLAGAAGSAAVSKRGPSLPILSHAAR